MSSLSLFNRAGVLVAMMLCGAMVTGRAAAQCEPITLLQTPDTRPYDAFGAAVAISGNTAVVGAPGHYTNSSLTGALYIYTNTTGAWTLQQEIADPATTGRIGQFVAISGNTIIAGTDHAGNLNIYTRAGTVWTYLGLLPYGGTDFVYSLALGSVGTHHLVCVVGRADATVGSLSQAGATDVYTFDTLAVGAVWTFAARLTAPPPPDAGAGDALGSSVAFSGGIAGGTALIGAPHNANLNGSAAGAAYSFVCNSNGGAWTYSNKFMAPPTPGGRANEAIGGSVGINQDTAVVGAFNANVAYLYGRSASTGLWSERQNMPLLGNAHVQSFRMVGDTVLAADASYSILDAGRVGMFTRPAGSGVDGVWTYRAAIRSSIAPAVYTTLTSTDLSGTNLILGVSGIIPNSNPAQWSQNAYILDMTGFCPADFDCSGHEEVADIFAFLNAWFAGTRTADFDGDNVLAIADIFAFLNAWFAGC